MSAVTPVERLQEQMRELKLPRTAEQLPSLLQDAVKRDLSCSDFLEELVTREIEARHERLTAMKTTMARFPFHKSLESFDFKFQPSIQPKVVRELAKSRFIADADNVLLLGPPGVGKTHLAIALGLKACTLGYRTLFMPAASMLQNLVRYHSENRLEVARSYYTNDDQAFAGFLREGLKNRPGFYSLLRFSNLNGLTLDGGLESSPTDEVSYLGETQLAYAGAFWAAQRFQVPTTMEPGEYVLRAELVTSLYRGDSLLGKV